MTAGVLAVSWSTAAAAIGKTLYVSPKGKDTNKCSQKAPCKTIGHAVEKARKGDTILVAHGTYREDVAIGKDVAVLGVGKPVVNALDRVNGFLISGSHAAGATVSGFVVEKALYEGIAAQKTSRVLISDNTVRGNDLGAFVKVPSGECAVSGNIPGDCGEGVHLMSVTHSKVIGNIVTGDSGGILLTDELGPTAHNLISKNTVTKNVLDCGITVAGHNPNAFAKGKTQPSVAGIYGNTISDNVVNGNGTKGFGAGILLATGAGPGSGVYNNLIKGNTANGNGLAGVTLHSHAPGEDLGGNRIIGNHVSNDGAAGDSEYGESGKVGILVGSGFTKQTGIVISGNTISNTHFGIYTKNAPKVSAKANKFHHVAVPVKQI